MLKSVIWTYVNKKPKMFEVQRYHRISSEDQLDNLIESLLDIDAVVSPSNLTFPVLLEVENGSFGPVLRKANIPRMRRQMKILQKQIDRIENVREDKNTAIKPCKIKGERR